MWASPSTPSPATSRITGWFIFDSVCTGLALTASTVPFTIEAPEASHGRRRRACPR
jgi:hypothetical protein